MTNFRRFSFFLSIIRDDIQSLTFYQFCSQSNYDLIEITIYEFVFSNLDFTTYEFFSNSQMNYNLTKITFYEFFRQIDFDEICSQRNINYNLTKITSYEIFSFNNFNKSRFSFNINYNLTKMTLYEFVLSQFEFEFHTHFSIFRTIQ